MEAERSLGCDIAVIGGGPAGIAAALSARHFGAEVILVETTGTLGGMSTGGGLNIWCGNAFSRLQNLIIERYNRRTVYDVEDLKCFYYTLLDDTGVKIITHTQPLEVDIEHGVINSAIIFGKGQKIRLSSKVYIDATGDGDFAAMSGVPFTLGRPSDGLTQPLSLEFQVGGLSDDAIFPNTFSGFKELEDEMKRWIDAGKISKPAGHVILLRGIQPHTAAVNMTNVNRVNGADILDRSRAEVLAHRQVLEIIPFLRECVKGYENCYLTSVAAYTGVRESRHFSGEYTLTEQDILNQTVFDDWIVSNAKYCFGIHSLTEVASAHDDNIPDYHGESYTIPYRSLLPKGISNLLLCGRNISGTHIAHSSYRVMPICMAVGEGAGLAAATAIHQNKALREIDIHCVQKILCEDYGAPAPI